MSFFPPEKHSISDSDLLDLFQQESHRAWKLFCEKHSDFIYTMLRHMGFDYDAAMERFVYVFEKLCEDDFRRLKSVKYAGDDGDLTPWLRQVVKNLCISWAWSKNGRKRILGFVKEMSEREQRIFKLYFWQGRTPFEIYEILRLEHDQDAIIEDVFDALEKIITHLSEKKLWRLISGLSRDRKSLSLDYEDEETGLKIEPCEKNGKSPEEKLSANEEKKELNKAFNTLSTREKLVLQFRYEEGLTLGETAKNFGWEKREAVNLHKSAIYKLRKLLL
ncbi:MAG: sigma-70 family RNA polymerase sigma factor [Pyrinomonadaceae bacterium]